MIGWSGRQFAGFKLPTRQRAIGAWNGEEAAQWLSVDRWPVLRINYTNVPEYVDTTLLGTGKIRVGFNTEGFRTDPFTGQANVFFFWQKAVRPEGQGLPWDVPESDWQYLPPDPVTGYGQQELGYVSLSLGGRLRINDRDHYRCILRGGLKVLPSPAIQNRHDILLINWLRHPQSITVPDSSTATLNAEAQAIGQDYGVDYSAESDPQTGERYLKLQYDRRVYLSTSVTSGSTSFTVTPNTGGLAVGDPLEKIEGSGPGNFGAGAAVQSVNSGTRVVVSTVPHSASGDLNFYGPWGAFNPGEAIENGQDFDFLAQFGIDNYLWRARAFVVGRTEPVYGNPVSNTALLDVT